MQITEFIARYIEGAVPCTFEYGGVPAESFGPLYEAGENLYARDWLSPDGMLRAVLKVRKFAAAVEWWLELEGCGGFDSAIVSGLKYASLTSEAAPCDGWKYPSLHWAHGSLAQADDFMPVEQNFEPETKCVLACKGGRASSGTLPYFNLQMTQNRGCIFAIGWTGRWIATFRRLGGPERRILFTAEMDDACFRVRPGEILSLPRTVALPWEGAFDEAQNAFRRFMRHEVLPKYDGKPLEGYVLMRAWGGLPPEIHRAKLENIKKHSLGAELYQIDAGWHGDETTPKSDKSYFDIWHKTIGTWKPLPALYPSGLSGMHGDCRDAGMEFCVWFEPERMLSWNKAVAEHRDYFVGAKIAEGFGNHSLMVNLGNPEARRWLTDQLCAVIRESGMEVFRIDYNYEPLDYWKYNDAPDRRGVSEILYVNGLYAMLDALLEQNPGLKIDNCASGGRRLDYRMFRRSMPMICRSDYFCAKDNDPDPKQAQTYGLSLWIPAHGDSLGSCIGHTPECMDTYRFRSSIASGIGVTAPWWDLTEAEAEWYRKMMSEAKRIRPFVAADFYPLTGYTLSERDWIAFQFNEPSDGGVVMAFRREQNASPTHTFELRGLDPDADYLLEDADRGPIGTYTGAQLAEALTLRLPEKRSSAIIFYRKT